MTTVVLVPGAGGAAGFWHLVVPLLEAGGLDAVAVDLPGPDPQVGLAGYADLITASARDADDVVLVAQSMGGFSAPLAVHALPVRRLVLLNAMVPLPGETAGEWWDHTDSAGYRAEAEARAGRDPQAPIDLETHFLHDVPAEAMAPLEERDEAEIAFTEPFPLDRWPDVATSVLVGEDDRLFPPELQRTVARDRLDLPVELVPGGHLAALSRPGPLAQTLVALARA